MNALAVASIVTKLSFRGSSSFEITEDRIAVIPAIMVLGRNENTKYFHLHNQDWYLCVSLRNFISYITLSFCFVHSDRSFSQAVERVAGATCEERCALPRE